MFERFKKRWDIKSNFQLLLIFIVFSVTGSTALYIRKGVFYLLGITSETDIWIRTIVYIITIVPAYYMMLLVVGFVFGQYKFARAFQKKMISRFKFIKK